MTLSNSAPWATIFACVITLVYAVVGGAVVIWGHPGTLSFEDYGKQLSVFVVGLGVLGVGRGIAAKSAPPKK